MLHDADPNESLQIVKFIDRLKMELEKNPSYLVDKTREFLIKNKSRIVEFHSLSFVSVKRKKKNKFSVGNANTISSLHTKSKSWFQI